jgi:hypothetical protein
MTVGGTREKLSMILPGWLGVLAVATVNRKF